MKLSKIIFVLFILIIIFEFILVFHESIQNEKQYRNIHCFYKDFLFLCSDIEKEILRKDNQKWKISTNTFGERITKNTLKTKEHHQEIWFIGDSISLGYLVNDEQSAPYLLDLKQKIPVRNLGVDSIGTIGILERLKKGLKDHPDITIEHLVWIYNTSDFTDDIIYNKKKWYHKLSFKIHYTISKYSNIYNLFLLLKKQQQNELPETQEISDEILNQTHITYQNIKLLKEYIQNESRIKNFIIILYPGMRHNKLPDIDSPIINSLEKFLKENNINYYKIFKEFEIANQPYLIFDGHPSEEGYEIFTKILIDHLKLL